MSRDAAAFVDLPTNTPETWKKGQKLLQSGWQNLGFKMQLGDESGAFVQTSLNFTDTGLPVNEIMDFVQMQIEEQIAELN